MKKSAKVAFIGSAIVFASIILLCINWYTQTKKKDKFYANRYLEYDVSIFSDEMQQKSEDRRNKYLSKLLEVRQMYKSDVIQKKEKLSEIMKNNNKSNYAKIFEIVPKIPHYPLTDKDSYLPNGEFNQSKIGFTWQLFRSSVDPDPIADKMSLQPYLEKGDTPISNSMGAGRKQLILWMSGRVTEKTMIENPALQIQPIPEGTPVHIYVETEVEPPFDFLQR